MFREYPIRAISCAEKCGCLCHMVNRGQLDILSEMNKHQVYFTAEQHFFFVAKGGIFCKYVVNLLLFMQPEVL